MRLSFLPLLLTGLAIGLVAGLATGAVGYAVFLSPPCPACPVVVCPEPTPVVCPDCICPEYPTPEPTHTPTSIPTPTQTPTPTKTNTPEPTWTPGPDAESAFYLGADLMCQYANYVIDSFTGGTYSLGDCRVIIDSAKESNWYGQDILRKTATPALTPTPDKKRESGP